MSNLELKMPIKTLAREGIPKREISRTLNLSEGIVRYHLKRLASDATVRFSATTFDALFVQSTIRSVGLSSLPFSGRPLASTPLNAKPNTKS